MNPFAAETYDETVESLQEAQQALQASKPPKDDVGGGAVAAAGAAGTAGSGGAGGSVSGEGGAGAGGPAGAGGTVIGSGGSVAGAAGSINGGAGGLPPVGGSSGGGVGGSGTFDGGAGVGGIPIDGGSVGGVGGVGGMAGTGGIAGSGGIGGTGGSAGGPTGIPSAFWNFDDCSPVTRTLLDSSGNGIHALRTVSAACAPGIQGQAVEFNEAGDRVEALNAPQFALDRQLAVAAWVNPTLIDNNRPVVLKRLQNDTAFSLRVQNQQAQFSVTLDNGQTITTRAPLQANTWSHIAGIFNGRFVFLFINGEQVGQIFAEGSIRDVDAPIRIGATTQQQRFVGLIDNVFLSTNPVTPTDIAALACIRQPSSLMVSPETSGPVPAGTSFPYAINVTNNDFGSCTPRNYFINSFAPSGFSLFTDPFAISVERGRTGTFNAVVTSSEDVDPGLVQIPFFINEFTSFEQLFGVLNYEVTEPTGCHVRTSRELFMRNPNIVDDPVRTSFDASSPEDPRTGAWAFGHLIENAAPSPEQAPEMMERVLRTWLTDQTVNSFVVGARPAIQFVIDAWPKQADGRLDLRHSPMRLLGIVNRVDLRDLDAGHAGEGRFVFGVEPNGFPIEFTMILEYRLAASSEDELRGWLNSWHALGSLPFPSEEYNAALQAITDRFTARNAIPSRPNGSAMLTLRSNEIALSSVWQLREFRLGTDGFLTPSTIALTPDAIFNGSERLARFINQNESSILIERHVVPDSFEDKPFRGGAILNPFDLWSAPGITNNQARHKFSLNTCNGCHGAETQTSFLQVSPRSPGQESVLSGFMTGIDVFDQFSGEVRHLNDLGRRNADLKALVCPPEAGLRVQQQAASPASGTTLRKGISRVH